MPNQLPSKYCIDQRLSIKGSTEIYRVTDLDQGAELRLTVWRRIVPEPESDFHRPFFERFPREMEAVKQLDHPHILPILEYGQAVRNIYKVTPYPAGETLQTRLKAEPLSIKESGHLLAQVAGVLDYVHARGLIHRDLNPAHIYLDPAGGLQLGSFEIAIITEALRQVDEFYAKSAIYSSPEQCAGQPLTAASDIYALGLILFEMLTGQPPFTGPDPVRLIDCHLNEPPPSPRTLRPDLPATIEPVIAGALAKQPQDRYSSAGALAVALRQIAAA